MSKQSVPSEFEKVFMRDFRLFADTIHSLAIFMAAPNVNTAALADFIRSTAADQADTLRGAGQDASALLESTESLAQVIEALEALRAPLRRYLDATEGLGLRLHDTRDGLPPSGIGAVLN